MRCFLFVILFLSVGLAVPLCSGALSTPASEVAVATVQGDRDVRASVPLSAEEPGLAWSATADQPWLTLENSTGSTPGDLQLRLDAGSLLPGTHSAEITVVSTGAGAGAPVKLPVRFTVEPLKLTFLKADPHSTKVYGISEDKDAAGAQAYLLEMDAATEHLLKAVPAGSKVSDLEIHSIERRLYVPNGELGHLLVFNQTTLALERTHTFAAGGKELYRVAAGNAGQLALEEWGDFAKLHLFDTAEGVKTGSPSTVQRGDGAFDPTRQFYYHADSNSSESRLRKLEVLGNKFVPRLVSGNIGYGSPVLVMSDNGQSVFWGGSHFNSSLAEQSALGAEIYACDATGRLAIGETKIFDTSTRQHILTLPNATKVSAYSSPAQKLVVQKDGGLSFHRISFPVTLAPPQLEVAPGGLKGTSVKVQWTDDALETGYNLQYRKVASGSWITAASPKAANETSATLTGLTRDTQYEIQLQRTGANGGSPWSTSLLVKTPPYLHITSFTTTDEMSGFRLSFSVSGIADSLLLERSLLHNGGWVEIATLPGTATSYVDTDGIKLDTLYYYRLTARAAGEYSNYWITSGSLSSPNLTLEMPFETEGRVVIKVNTSPSLFTVMLQRRMEGQDAWLDFDELPAGNTFWITDYGTQPSTTYEYRLKALPESVLMKVGTPVSITTQPLVVPLKPTNFGMGATTPAQVQLRWTDVFRETGYRLERREAASSLWTVLATLNASTTAYLDRTVTAGASYWYRLTPFNSKGDGPSAETFLVKAGDLAVILQDDFDPAVDVLQWSAVSAPGAVNGGAGFNGTQSLWLGHAGSRVVQTREVDVRGGGVIEFSFRAGHSLRDGVAYWEDSETGEEVLLEYSTNGKQWTYFHPLITGYPSLSDWTDVSVPIPPAACTVATSFRWRQQKHSGAGQDTWALDNVQIRAASRPSWTLLTKPSPQLVVAGADASLTVTSSEASATFQWFKDAVLIPGAVSSSLSVADATPADAGHYHCLVQFDGVTLATDAVVLGVIRKAEPAGGTKAEAGASFNLEMDIYPAGLENELTYAWSRVPAGTWEDIGLVSGEHTRTLTVDDVTLAAQAAYQCQVSWKKDSTLVVGPYPVKVLQAPKITPVADQEVVVNNPVDIAIQTDDPEAAVQVAGLPKGLTFDAATGRIRGSLAALKSYTLTVTAGNAYGSAEPVSFQLSVVGFPASLAGSYMGVLLAEETLPHRGQASCQITAKGSATGTVTIRGKSYRFSAPVTAAPDGAWARVRAAFKDAAKQEYEAEIQVTAGAAQHRLVLHRKNVEGTWAIATGKMVRNEWSVTNPAPGAGILNAALSVSAQEAAVFPNPDKPQGTGFLNLTLTPRGVVTCKGRLADGQAVTGSSVMGPGGDIPVFVNLYAGKGSFGSLLAYDEGVISGRAYWGKDDLGETSKDRVHKRGFEPHWLTLQGGLHVKPAVNMPLLSSMTTVPARARLDVAAQAGLPLPLTQSLSFSAKHQAELPKAGVLNPQGFTLSLNAATGLFTGSFKLADENPAKAGQILRRTVSFQGALIPGQDKGAGYFLLPELPSATVKGSSLSNTPVWSGSVELLPGWLQN
ncbi:MAG TPA: putative Ig domain-containing protein [Prosthecobacter sp.]